MTTVKQIQTQGANIKRVTQPFIVSTGKSMTKAEARAQGVLVDNIAKYTNLTDTAVIFPLFTEENIDVCVLQIEVTTLSGNNIPGQNPTPATQNVSVEIRTVLVDSVIQEINAGLSGLAISEVTCSYRHNRIQILASDKVTPRGVLHEIQELRILDSRGNPNTQSVSDLSNPVRLFNYFYPDGRAVSKIGDVESNPPREDYITPRSIGISQGEPRTSESLNRHLDFSAGKISDLSATTDRLLLNTKKVRIPLTITEDEFSIAVDYSASEQPAAIWHTWNGDFLSVGVQNNQFVQIGGNKRTRTGALLAEQDNNVTMLALRGISPSGINGYEAKIVNVKGEHRGLISPDRMIRAPKTSASLSDRGIAFPENLKWRIVDDDISHAYSDDFVNNFLNSPFNPNFNIVSNIFGRTLAVNGDLVIDIDEIQELNTSLRDSPFTYTLVDSVTLDISEPVKARYPKALLNIEGSDTYFIVREWINDTRCIISEINDALAASLNLIPANLSDLSASGNVVFHTGPIVNDQQWLFFIVNNTGGHLRWLEEEQLYLEIDVHECPSEINGLPVLTDFVDGPTYTTQNSLIRASGIYDRLGEEQSAITLKSIHESTPFDVSIGKASGGPIQKLDLLPYTLLQTIRSSNKAAVARDPFGLTLNQLEDSADDTITANIGPFDPDVNLSDARLESTDPLFADGIDQFLFEKFLITKEDVRYSGMRRLTLLFSSGVLGNATFYPEKLELISTEDIFKEEHVGLFLFLSSIGRQAPIVCITGIIDGKICEVSYLTQDREAEPSDLPFEVQLDIAPRKEILTGRLGGTKPALTIEGIGSLGGNVEESPALKIRGRRTLESTYYHGDILSELLGNADFGRTLSVMSINGQNYLNVYFSPTFNSISYSDLPVGFKVNGEENFGSIAGLVKKGDVDTDDGYPELHSGENPSTSDTHVIPRVYKICQAQSSSLKQHANIEVDSSRVILVVDRNNPNLAYGIQIPIPDFLVTTAGVNNQLVAIVGEIRVFGCQISLNYDETNLENLSSHNAKVLNNMTVVSAASPYAKTEINSTGIKHHGLNRPELASESSIVTSVSSNSTTTHATLKVKHDYPPLDNPDSDTDVSSELFLGDGSGSGVAAQTANTLRVDDDSLFLNTESLLSVSNPDFATSVHPGGFFGTSPSSRGEDIGPNELTGFDHRELSGDLSVSQSTVTELAKELDEMKEREFSILKQLSYHAAMHHEALDMLRTAKSSIKMLRNVQYELIMSLIAVADLAKKRDDASDTNTVRFGLRSIAGTDQNGDQILDRDLMHRLTRASLQAGHLINSGLLNFDPTSIVPGTDLSALLAGTTGFAPLYENTHTSSPGWDSVDAIPLDYRRPGYNKIVTRNGNTLIGSQEGLDPRNTLVPVTNTGEGAHPLYTLATSALYRNKQNVGRENISWSDALEEFSLVQLQAVNTVTEELKSMVVSISPGFSVKARASGIDNVVNEVVSYVMGIGYWSLITTGTVNTLSTDLDKSTPITSGWSFILDAHRMVGPNQVAMDSDVYCDSWSENSIDSHRSAMIDISSLNSNSPLYDDVFIRNQISNKRDLVFGVMELTSANDQFTWSVKMASYLGFSLLYKDAFQISTLNTDYTKANYDTFEEASLGDALFYTVAEDERPAPVIPYIYNKNSSALGHLATLPNNYLPNSGTGTRQALNTDNAAQMPTDESKRVVYLRAWCVARAQTEQLLLAKLNTLGYAEDDLRIKIELIDQDFVAVRTKIGISDLFKSLISDGLRAPAANGQLLFSFRGYNSGIYLDTQGTKKRSESY